jgi:hypothetical protein
MTKTLRLFALAVGFAIAASPSAAADLDRAAVDFTVPADIKWVRNAAGTNEQAVLFGDPSKPGPYVVRIKWFPGNMSRPHFHPERPVLRRPVRHLVDGHRRDVRPRRDRARPRGSYVIHYGGKVHYDGAKGEETIIQVWGMGPATSTPAGVR